MTDTVTSQNIDISCWDTLYNTDTVMKLMSWFFSAFPTEFKNVNLKHTHFAIFCYPIHSPFPVVLSFLSDAVETASSNNPIINYHNIISYSTMPSPWKSPNVAEQRRSKFIGSRIATVTGLYRIKQPIQIVTWWWYQQSTFWLTTQNKDSVFSILTVAIMRRTNL
jgi:hypothetical protein